MRLSFLIQGRLPAPERFVLRGGGWGRVPLALRYGILERAGHGPVLIDAGWPVPGPGAGRALRLYDWIMGATLDPALAPEHVTPEAVLLSHLHADHVGALTSLPAGTPVHTDAAAWTRARKGGWQALRHAVFAELLPPQTNIIALNAGAPVELPFGLGQGHDVLGDGSVLSVALPGHADGHTGFVFPAFDTPVLYAADAQWLLAALEPGRAPRGPMTRVYSDPNAVPDTIARVHAFARAGGRVVLNHDPAPAGPFEA